jgi:hypothetical protein
MNKRFWELRSERRERNLFFLPFLMYSSIFNNLAMRNERILNGHWEMFDGSFVFLNNSHLLFPLNCMNIQILFYEKNHINVQCWITKKIQNFLQFLKMFFWVKSHVNLNLIFLHAIYSLFTSISIENYHQISHFLQPQLKFKFSIILIVFRRLPRDGKN